MRERVTTSFNNLVTKRESGDDWDKDIEEDVRAECSKHGPILHIKVDRDSEVFISKRVRTCTHPTIRGIFISSTTTFRLLRKRSSL
jgi:hypothetical protein